MLKAVSVEVLADFCLWKWKTVFYRPKKFKANILMQNILIAQVFLAIRDGLRCKNLEYDQQNLEY